MNLYKICFLNNSIYFYFYNSIKVDWQRELLNAFVNDRSTTSITPSSTTSSTTSFCPSLQGVYIFRLNQLVEMEQLLYSLSLRYLPFLEHLLNDLINDNSENQNNRKIDTNNKKDVKILKLISNSGSSKIDLNLLKLNKMHVLLQKLRNLGPKSTVGKKGKSKGTAGTGGGEEEGESVGEKEVHNFFLFAYVLCLF